MDAGAFSDESVVNAAKDLVLILVDNTKSPHPIAKKYPIRGYPTLMFVGPKGEKIRDARGRSASALIADFKEISSKHSLKIDWKPSIKDAMEAGKKKGAMTVVFFADSRDKKSPIVEGLFFDSGIQAMLDKVVIAKHEVKKGCEVCKEHRVRKGPEIHFYDSNTGKAIKKVRKFKSAEHLKKAMADAQEEFEKAKKAAS